MSQCPICGEVKCPGMPDCGLLCIAGSPLPEHGGFHEKTVAIAKSALAELTTLRASLAEYQGAMRAQDQREDAAGVRCGVLRGYSGCDWPDAVAEEVLTLRASLEQARGEIHISDRQLEEATDQLRWARAELEQVRGAADKKTADVAWWQRNALDMTTLLRAKCDAKEWESIRLLTETELRDRVLEIDASLPAPPSPSKKGR